MDPKEITIQTPYLKLAAKRWGSPQKPTILAFHGWLDNAASFDGIAPLLKNHCVIAIDAAGHGLSQHRQAGTSALFIHEVITAWDIVNALYLDSVILMGHSMGGGVTSLLAGILGERVHQLILIESLGALSIKIDGTIEQIKTALRIRSGIMSRRTPKYAKIKDMADIRLAIGGIHPDSVACLMERGVMEFEDGFTWRSDPNLKIASPLRMSESQIQEFLSHISAPTLLIQAKDGMMDKWDTLEERKIKVKNLKCITLEGNHHLHMDTPYAVAKEIIKFIESSDKSLS